MHISLWETETYRILSSIRYIIIYYYLNSPLYLSPSLPFALYTHAHRTYTPLSDYSTLYELLYFYWFLSSSHRLSLTLFLPPSRLRLSCVYVRMCTHRVRLVRVMPWKISPIKCQCERVLFFSRFFCFSHNLCSDFIFASFSLSLFFSPSLSLSASFIWCVHHHILKLRWFGLVGCVHTSVHTHAHVCIWWNETKFIQKNYKVTKDKTSNKYGRRTLSLLSSPSSSSPSSSSSPPPPPPPSPPSLSSSLSHIYFVIREWITSFFFCSSNFELKKQNSDNNIFSSLIFLFGYWLLRSIIARACVCVCLCWLYLVKLSSKWEDTHTSCTHSHALRHTRTVHSLTQMKVLRHQLNQ